MKKIALISMMMLMSVATFASKHVSNDAVVVADTVWGDRSAYTQASIAWSWSSCALLRISCHTGSLRLPCQDCPHRRTRGPAHDRQTSDIWLYC